MRRLFLAPALLLALALPLCAETVTVFAAASLKTALDRVGAGFTAATGHDLAISYAGSGQLALQIRQGAPAQIFLSASPEWMDAVEAEGLLEPGSRRDLLGNRLVLIAHDPSAPPMALAPGVDLVTPLAGGRLAVALTEAVPAGQYAKSALQSLEIWDKTAPHLAQSDNARTVLALVALGEAPYGIAYATDARAEPRVQVVATFPPESHPEITYPEALIAPATPAAHAFHDWLVTPEARAIFADEGFTEGPAR